MIANPLKQVAEDEQQHSGAWTQINGWFRSISASVALLTVLVVGTELGAVAVLAITTPGVKVGNSHHSYYQKQPWSEQYWKEIHTASPTHYSPFIGWRRAPFKGQYVNLDPDGLRRTVNPDCSTGARQIWIFGSSTLWGTGATDEQTIPSILSREYAQAYGSVCVTNFSEAGWVSTQNVIQLELALKKTPRPPDLVLFDDGYADVFAVWESGRADVHMEFERIRNVLEASNKSSAFDYLQATGTYRLMTVVMNKVARLKASGGHTGPVARDLDSLAQLAVENYIQNIKLVDALSKGYGFRYNAFWGPALFVGSKPLSGPERRLLSAQRSDHPDLVDLSRKTYARMFASPHPNIFDISDTFNSTPEDIYLDASHVTPVGTRLVALRMLDILNKHSGDQAPAR
jgi:hypothetical protein